MTDLPPNADASDIALDELARTPFLIHQPERTLYPFVFASPHSGRHYPLEFRDLSPLSDLDIRRSEDAWADLLFDTSALAVPRIAACFPRAYVDVNRSPLEIDIEMFDGPLAFPTERTLHVLSGFGILPRLIREGMAIHRGKITPQELTQRIEKFYFPYHRALSYLMRETHARFGLACLIDCHTMPAGPDVADVVLGDRFGSSAPAQLMRRAEIAFASQGFSVMRNQPYAGGFTTEKFARSAEQTYALQIEIRRDLYMDEERLTLRSDFAAVRHRIGQALISLMKSCRLHHAAQNMSDAAE